MRTDRFRAVLAALLALQLTFPCPASAAAPGTQVGHEPPKDYIPGFRIVLEAEVRAEGKLRAARCYFRTRNEPNFVYVEMSGKKRRYEALLPAPWVGSQEVEYLFVVVNEAKQVYRSPLYRIPERKTPQLKKWKEVGEQREVRLDRIQEFAELYAALRKDVGRLGRHERLPDWQRVADGDPIEVWTELGAESAQVGGFWDALVVYETGPEAAFGVVAEGLYTPAQAAAAGGASAAAATTGAQAAGTAAEISTNPIWWVLGGAAVVGGGAAAVATTGVLDGGGDGGIDVRDAKASDFVGTYDATDPNRPTSEYSAVFVFRSGGTGTITERIGGTVHTGNIIWSFNEVQDVFSIAAQPGGRASGKVTGTVREFTLNGHYSNGSPATLRMRRR